MLNLKSTWGDRHYIGLNAIEIFSSEGSLVPIRRVGKSLDRADERWTSFEFQITADPPDINILPEYGNDPRVVTNLIDGVNRTRDDIHMWLAPFTAGQRHLITILFERPASVAMIRIWVRTTSVDDLRPFGAVLIVLKNYNKSRIHSVRGARDVEITLDDRTIFKGEIGQACGNVTATNDPSAFGEVSIRCYSRSPTDRSLPM